MASTYEPIASTTLGSAAASYTFSSIPATFTDLVLVTSIVPVTGSTTARVQFNSDTGSNYSDTEMYGSGSAAASTRSSSNTSVLLAWTESGRATISTMSVMSYANGTTYTTALSTYAEPQSYVSRSVGLWRSTAAVSSIKIFLTSGNNLDAGSTFSLYGIKAA